MSINDRKLKRIITECLEVGFVICNNDMEEFGASKIFDVFEQVFPTAYVLNTGYWPFYSLSQGNSLCVCGRFGIYCRHIKSGNHWIDLSGVRNVPGHQIFFPKYYGPVFPVDFSVFLKSLPVGCPAGYDINIVIKVQYRQKPSNKPEKYKSPTEILSLSLGRAADIYSEIFTFQIISRFHMTSQFYPPTATIVFHPNPFYHRFYSNYFKTLLDERQADSELREMASQIYCCATRQMAPTTFKRRYVNLPIALVPPRVAAFSVSSSEARRRRQLQTASFPVSNTWNNFHNTAQAHGRFESTKMESNVGIMSDTATITTIAENMNESGIEPAIPSTSGLQNLSDNQGGQPLQSPNQNSVTKYREWFLTNFPPLRGFTDSAVSMDEDLELIDSIIREDCAKEESDLDEEEFEY